MRSETIVRLKITSGIHDPEFISQILGIPCDRGWKIGDKRPNTIIEEKLNGWVLDSGLDKTVSLDEQIGALLQKIRPFRDRIKNALAGDNVELSCVIYADSTPSLNFEDAVISELSAIGASLDVDLYI